MRGNMLVVAATVSMCAGCLHVPPNYPGAGGDNPDPQQYANVPCVDLSGRYEGTGEIIDGDPGSLLHARMSRLDRAFPFSDKEQLAIISAAAARSDGFYAYPLQGVIAKKSARTFLVTFTFQNGRAASFTPSFEDATKYVCTGSSGKIVWGGGGLEGRSEFGPNKSDFMAALYLDEQGNLIVEDRMQVHMSLRLLHIPTGTAQHYTVYRFRRLK
ncbi:hypothetical protein HXP34_16125 [Ralstonia solanacearum]|uniref:hypothetical protein n=2 Tax=Ralstonia solanacearum TaxID=305 RepID=UPI00070E6DF6|nr:hypothetical protein [Ralstonia solanacearum]MBB6592699.1 hypothetical protein [Ralstonia solanacearum]MBB6596923.1 hypothetical protein [Ralstonia solanacearum]MDB0543760.1 hypothetical protein [Ralstonia solanacearum]